MFSEVEITLFWTWRIKLLDACMVELFGGEYAFAIMMEAKKKKNIFGNWTKHRMCGDYYPMNK